MTAMDYTILSYNEKEFNDRLKKLYPAVNEEETPLPRKWSTKDKFTYIGLSQDNLKVQYKGFYDSVIYLYYGSSIFLTHGLPVWVMQKSKY